MTDQEREQLACAVAHRGDCTAAIVVFFRESSGSAKAGIAFAEVNELEGNVSLR